MKKLIWPFLIAICAACAEQESQQVLPAATGSTYQMMTSYLEPAADKIWGSAGLIITEDGEVDLTEKSENSKPSFTTSSEHSKRSKKKEKTKIKVGKCTYDKYKRISNMMALHLQEIEAKTGKGLKQKENIQHVNNKVNPVAQCNTAVGENNVPYINEIIKSNTLWKKDFVIAVSAR